MAMIRFDAAHIDARLHGRPAPSPLAARRMNEFHVHMSITKYTKYDCKINYAYAAALRPPKVFGCLLCLLCCFLKPRTYSP
jgi:hypothetical protein